MKLKNPKIIHKDWIPKRPDSSLEHQDGIFNFLSATAVQDAIFTGAAFFQPEKKTKRQKLI